MAPSLGQLSTAVLAVAGGAAAERFKLADSYDYTNFFEKFNWMTHPDYNNGHVKYQSLDKALEKGIAAINGKEIYLGVDHTTKFTDDFNPGRPSFRIESKAVYGHGLIVGRFNHMPKPVCGSWPAFWTLGSGRDWPNAGEIDIYEGWNENFINKPAIHVGNDATYGSCMLDGANQTSPVHTAKNCDNTFQNPPLQWRNEGCVAHEKDNGIWGSPNGGTQAMEWTSDYIKIYTWPRGSEPADIDSSTPDTSTWGMPSVNLKKEYCDIDKAFTEQRIILNVALCGNPVGEHYFWNEFKGQSGNSCSVTTQEKTCVDYVSRHPEDFEDVHYKVQDIRYFELDKSTATTSHVSTSTTSKMTSSQSTTSTSSSTSSKETTSKSTKQVSTSSSKAMTSSQATSSHPSTSAFTPASSTSTKPTTSMTRKQSSSKIPTSSTAGTSSIEPKVVSSSMSTSGSSTSNLSSSIKALKPVGSSSRPTAAIPTTLNRESKKPVHPATTSQAIVPTSTKVHGSVHVYDTSAMTESPVEMTTSTVYTTSVSTITSCPPHVDARACSGGRFVTTVTIPLYTTICPVDAIETSGPKPTNIPGVVPETVVAKVTKIYTITSCPPTVVRCTVGSATTEIGTTTYCPGVQCALPTPDAHREASTEGSHDAQAAICPGPLCRANKVFSGMNQGKNRLGQDFEGKNKTWETEKVRGHVASGNGIKPSVEESKVHAGSANSKGSDKAIPHGKDMDIDVFGADDAATQPPAEKQGKTPVEQGVGQSDSRKKGKTVVELALADNEDKQRVPNNEDAAAPADKTPEVQSSNDETDCEAPDCQGQAPVRGSPVHKVPGGEVPGPVSAKEPEAEGTLAQDDSRDKSGVDAQAAATAQVDLDVGDDEGAVDQAIGEKHADDEAVAVPPSHGKPAGNEKEAAKPQDEVSSSPMRPSDSEAASPSQPPPTEAINLGKEEPASQPTDAKCEGAVCDVTKADRGGECVGDDCPTLVTGSAVKASLNIGLALVGVAIALF